LRSALEQGHDSLACLPAVHVYVAAVGIAGKAIPLSSQHPIHLVENTLARSGESDPP